MNEEFRKFFAIKRYQRETFVRFIGRLCTQAKLCKFIDEDLLIKQQIILNCNVPGVKEKVFDAAINLKQLIRIISSMEKCSRCGNRGHLRNDINCPVQIGRCEVCHNFGHSTNVCRTALKIARKNFAAESSNNNPPKVFVSSNPALEAATNSNVGKQNYHPKIIVRDDLKVAKGFITADNIPKPTITANVSTVTAASSSTSITSDAQQVLPLIEIKKEISSIPDDSRKFLDCLVGHMSCKFVISSGSLNVMSYKTYRKMVSKKYLIDASDLRDLKVNNKSFCGVFATLLEVQNNERNIIFYIKPGHDEFVVISEKIAKKMGVGNV